MRYFSPQHKKEIVRFTGCVVIPGVLLTPLLSFGIHDYNITGLLNLKGYELWFHLIAMGILLWADLLLFHIMQKEKVSFAYLILLNLLIILALSVPYREGYSLVNTVHIISAYGAFAFFVSLFTYLLRIYPKHLLCFLMLSVFCVFLCLGAGKVTGLAEAVFGCGVSILLSLLF